jgi:hypothetical protein
MQTLTAVEAEVDKLTMTFSFQDDWQNGDAVPDNTPPNSNREHILQCSWNSHTLSRTLGFVTDSNTFNRILIK